MKKTRHIYLGLSVLVLLCGLCWIIAEASILFIPNSPDIKVEYTYLNSEFVQGIIMDKSGKMIPCLDIGIDNTSGGMEVLSNENGWFCFIPSDDPISIETTIDGKEYLIGINQFSWRKLRGTFLVIVVDLGNEKQSK